MEIHGFTTFGIQSSRSSSEVVDGTSIMNLQKIKQNSGDQYLQIHSKKEANADSQLNIGDPPDPDPYSQVKSLPFRVKFPTFDGSQVRLWMLRCEEYFDLHPSFSEEEKRELAAMNFVGRAALWYQEFSIKNKYNLLSWISWQQFIGIVSARFEDIRIATMADELNQLKYEGNYEDYVGKFEETRKQMLQIQNRGLLCDNYAYNETYFLMTFLRGLNGKLKSVVSKFNPTNLQQAIDMGRIKIYLGIALEKEVVPLQPLSMEKESFASGLVKKELECANERQGVDNFTTFKKNVVEHNQLNLQEHSSQTITNIFTDANISTSTKNPTPSYTGAQTKTKMSLPETGLSSFPLVNLANDEVVRSVRVEKAELVPDTVKKKFLEISADHGEEVRLSLNMFNFASLQRTCPARSFTNTIKSQKIKTHLALPERKFPQVSAQLLMETQIGGLHDSNSPYEWGEIYLSVNNKEQRISHLIKCEEERIAYRKHMKVMIDSSKDFKQHDQLSIFPLGEIAELCSLEYDTVYGNDMEEKVNSALYWDINWWEIGNMNLSLEMVITSYGSGVVVNENSCLYTKSEKIIYGCKESDNNFSYDSPKAYNAIDFLRMEGLMELFEATTYYCVPAAKFNMLQLSQISGIQAGKAYFHNRFRQKEFRRDKLLYQKLQLHEKNFVDFTTKAKSSPKWFAKLYKIGDNRIFNVISLQEEHFSTKLFEGKVHSLLQLPKIQETSEEGMPRNFPTVQQTSSKIELQHGSQEGDQPHNQILLQGNFKIELRSKVTYICPTVVSEQQPAHQHTNRKLHPRGRIKYKAWCTELGIEVWSPTSPKISETTVSLPQSPKTFEVGVFCIKQFPAAHRASQLLVEQLLIREEMTTPNLTPWEDEKTLKAMNMVVAKEGGSYGGDDVEVVRVDEGEKIGFLILVFEIGELGFVKLREGAISLPESSTPSCDGQFLLNRVSTIFTIMYTYIYVLQVLIQVEFDDLFPEEVQSPVNIDPWGQGSQNRGSIVMNTVVMKRIWSDRLGSEEVDAESEERCDLEMRIPNFDVDLGNTQLRDGSDSAELWSGITSKSG